MLNNIIEAKNEEIRFLKERQAELETELKFKQKNVFLGTPETPKKHMDSCSPLRPSPQFKDNQTSPQIEKSQTLESQLKEISQIYGTKTSASNLEEQLKRLLHDNYEMKILAVNQDQELMLLR